jgi:putative chitinase
MNYLVEYQKLLGLTADGVMGPNTAKAIMADLGITDKLLFAHMMGQVAHESGLYKNARENLNYNAAGLLNIFKKYYTQDLAKKHERKPEMIANHVYANRMGNGDEASGDGWKYRGIFGLQLTGKDNIQAFISYLGLPINTAPDSLLDNPKNYFLAGLYWFTKNCVDKLCRDTSDACILGVTKRVNGGTNGLEDRKVQTHKMFKALGLA